MESIFAAFMILPVIYAATLEFKDVKLKYHAYVSLMTAVLLSVVMLIPAVLAMATGGALTWYGISMSGFWTLFLIPVAFIVDLMVYWIMVGFTKLVEAIVPGM